MEVYKNLKTTKNVGLGLLTFRKLVKAISHGKFWITNNTFLYSIEEPELVQPTFLYSIEEPELVQPTFLYSIEEPELVQPTFFPEPEP